MVESNSDEIKSLKQKNDETKIMELFETVYNKSFLLNFVVKSEGFSSKRKAILVGFKLIQFIKESKDMLQALEKYSLLPKRYISDTLDMA